MSTAVAARTAAAPAHHMSLGRRAGPPGRAPVGGPLETRAGGVLRPRPVSVLVERFGGLPSKDPSASMNSEQVAKRPSLDLAIAFRTTLSISPGSSGRTDVMALGVSWRWAYITATGLSRS